MELCSECKNNAVKKWISFSYEKPADGQECWIAFKEDDEDIVTQAEFRIKATLPDYEGDPIYIREKEFHNFFQSEYKNILKNVTHWMFLEDYPESPPFPEAPKERE